MARSKGWPSHHSPSIRAIPTLRFWLPPVKCSRAFSIVSRLLSFLRSISPVTAKMIATTELDIAAIAEAHALFSAIDCLRGRLRSSESTTASRLNPPYAWESQFPLDEPLNKPHEGPTRSSWDSTPKFNSWRSNSSHPIRGKGTVTFLMYGAMTCNRLRLSVAGSIREAGAGVRPGVSGGPAGPRARRQFRSRPC
jgi:hypothetical protein